MNVKQSLSKKDQVCSVNFPWINKDRSGFQLVFHLSSLMSICITDWSEVTRVKTRWVGGLSDFSPSLTPVARSQAQSDGVQISICDHRQFFFFPNKPQWKWLIAKLVITDSHVYHLWAISERIRPKLLTFYSCESLFSLLHSFKSLNESCICEHMSVCIDQYEKNKLYSHLTLKSQCVI